MRRLLLAVGLSIAVGACSTPQTDYLRRHADSVPEKGAVAKPVFFAQRTKECGPAALAMVLAHSGVGISPDELVSEVYNLGREGSLTPAVLAAARRHARIAYPINNLTHLLQSVSQGRPALVLQNLSFSFFSRWHYAVVVGYDMKEESITLHSGKTQFLKMPLETFEHTWSRGGYWALVTLRPGEFPDPVDEPTYVKAIAGVERAGHARVAAQAYEAAVGRWPNSLIGWMGLGNALYKIKETRAAAAAFQNAALHHPKNASAFNNLAHVFGELGQYDAAERAALRAVELGGRNQAVYQKTLRDIQATRDRKNTESR